MRTRAVVVTDMREPLVVVHRRLIRRRSVLAAIWIAGWAATGFVSDVAWLACTLLVITGPALWLLVWAWTARFTAGRREPVGRRELAAPAAPDAAAGR
ncbi:hypothetical protein [Pseudonocardia sp. GCM10023141]|uniref:hypothetical protein n=1 Tax=Pseudonocardia sp. GCM10023141 TaxID=3252653 RepID=UPI003615DA81